jgi:predicted sulfurtransferase
MSSKPDFESRYHLSKPPVAYELNKIRTLTCPDCKQEFTTNSVITVRCPQCSKARAKKRQNKYQQKRRAKGRKNP